MNIQETIKHLQSSIKKRGRKIEMYERFKQSSKDNANTSFVGESANLFWRDYHEYKETINLFAKQQKIEKSLYKLMLNIAKNSPNGSISLYTIREM